jgi:hypothetical protein
MLFCTCRYTYIWAHNRVTLDNLSDKIFASFLRKCWLSSQLDDKVSCKPRPFLLDSVFNCGVQFQELINVSDGFHSELLVLCICR